MITYTGWYASCQDCGAGTGAPCAEDCPTRQTIEAQQVLDDLANVPEACCPSAQYAAATLCGCGGPVRRVAA